MRKNIIFRNWVLQNFPFIEGDVDSLTDYELFSRGFEYLNKKKLNKNEVPDINSFATKEDLSSYTKTDDLSEVALTGKYIDLLNRPVIPNKTSQLVNDSNYVESTDLSTVAFTGDYDDLTDKPTIPDVSNFITKDVNDLTYYTLSSNLSTVATTGDYDDLLDKPTIPDVSNFITKDVNNLTYYTTTTDLNTALGNKANKSDVDNLLNYSSESVVGTWNNKPVYRRLISQTTPSGVNYQQLINGNINELIMSSGFIKYDGSNARPINMMGILASDSSFRIDYSNDNHSVYANYTQDLRSKDYTIVLEYTKIND